MCLEFMHDLDGLFKGLELPLLTLDFFRHKQYGRVFVALFIIIQNFLHLKVLVDEEQSFYLFLLVVVE